MEDSINMGEPEYEKKEMILFGLVGAVVGTVPGIILWVIIGQLGFIASISGALIALGALFGYKLLGRGFSIFGVILCGLAILAAVFAAICLDYIVYVMRNYQSSLTESIEILKIAVKSSDEFRFDFIKSTALGYVFAFIGSARIFIRVVKQLG